MNQPNFTKILRSLVAFARHQDTDIEYVVREASNTLHDLACLMELTDGMLVNFPQMLKQNRALCIPLLSSRSHRTQRPARPVTRKCSKCSPPETSCQIKVYGAGRLRWILRPNETNPAALTRIWVSESFRSYSIDVFDLIFGGESWEFRVPVRKSHFQCMFICLAHGG